MHAYTRLPSPGHLQSSSPPESPPSHLISSPRLRYGRTKSGGGRPLVSPPTAIITMATAPIPPRTLWQRLACLLLSLLLRRHGFFLLAPLIYISGMLIYMGTLPFDLPPPVVKAVETPPAGSVYSSPKLFTRLWPSMEKANGSYGASHSHFI